MQGFARWTKWSRFEGSLRDPERLEDQSLRFYHETVFSGPSRCKKDGLFTGANISKMP